MWSTSAKNHTKTKSARWSTVIVQGTQTQCNDCGIVFTNGSASWYHPSYGIKCTKCLNSRKIKTQITNNSQGWSAFFNNATHPMTQPVPCSLCLTSIPTGGRYYYHAGKGVLCDNCYGSSINTPSESTECSQEKVGLNTGKPVCLNLGCAPKKEQIACFGTPKYKQRVEREMVIWEETLISMHGEPPHSAEFNTIDEKRFGGREFNVGIYYDNNNNKATFYAENMYNNLPNTWKEVEEKTSIQQSPKAEDGLKDEYFVLEEKISFSRRHGISKKDPNFYHNLAMWGHSFKGQLNNIPVAIGLTCMGCGTFVAGGPLKVSWIDKRDPTNQNTWFCFPCGQAINDG